MNRDKEMLAMYESLKRESKTLPMTRFRATIQGNRGAASRLGGVNSGVEASVNGWDIGVGVKARVDGESARRSYHDC